jgi:hypothetical protein
MRCRQGRAVPRGLLRVNATLELRPHDDRAAGVGILPSAIPKSKCWSK